ncbi:MAG TPA: thioredoxin [Candidatus Poseidoniales archaeon]|jgi:thioredoxin 1|nr:thioredoxin [Euryarchaeota archaeon]DAC49712.1 MAG TPA: thioredoxin [Candidatus Poseidoniales archaeon]HII32746.1 thioredoxin [Candidatus Poseidoniaceae archaeon]|tara:strand:+ start:217 stop:591 length:375 start_codon:yes stop_codon:yes gene_type:complete
MATLEMQNSSFTEIVEGNNLVIIDFWAEWCGPCRAYAPVFERVSEEFPDVVFAKVDTEVEQALAGSFGIRSIPTTIAFKEGIGVFMQPGALPEDALRDLIGKLQELNMDEVRAELEERDSEETA